MSQMLSLRACPIWADSFVHGLLNHMHAWSAYNALAHDMLWLVLRLDATEVALQVSWQFLVPYVSEVQSTPLV